MVTIDYQGFEEFLGEADTRTSRSNTTFLSSRLPHPIPYQGSKRNLASQILTVIKGKRFRRFYEPFAGSAAITLAATHLNIADEYILSDNLAPLVSIWEQILSSPHELANTYERLWSNQLQSDASYYNTIRAMYNHSLDPASLLYLLVRCVKNAPRFNTKGEFNQSHDKRRLGMHPGKMRREILGASVLLARRAKAVYGDFEHTTVEATSEDIIYMDPPYEGTSTTSDKRYYQSLARERLIDALAKLNARRVPFLLSYDGQCGDKTYGLPLPKDLRLTRLEMNAGRSSQSTLSGRAEVTTEVLYISHSLL